MANYCFNRIIIDGDETAVSEALPFFIDDANQVNFSITLPRPEIMNINPFHIPANIDKEELPDKLYEVPEAFYEDHPLQSVSVLKDEIKADRKMSIVYLVPTQSSVANLFEFLQKYEWYKPDDNIVQTINKALTYAKSTESESDDKIYFLITSLICLYYDKYIAPYCLSEYGYTGWYDWSLANWGCKWNAYDVDVIEENHIYDFCTAWSPPIEWFNNLAEVLRDKGIYVNIQINFAEPGIGFGGEIHHTADGGFAEVTYNNQQIGEFLDITWEDDGDDTFIDFEDNSISK